MSVHVVSWAYKQTVGDHLAKFVLIKLADNANDEGLAWPGPQRISDETEIPLRTVMRKLTYLEEKGFISREQRRSEGGSWGKTIYQIHRMPPDVTVASDRLPPRERTRASTFSEINHQKSTAPKPPGTDLVRSNGRGTGLAVNKVAVTVQELALAEEVLAAFNALTGSNPPFSSQGWVRKIVMRIREHPTVDVEGHVEVVRRALANPWWDGPASPAVVYGNDTVFEQAMVSNGTTKRKRRYGLGVTPGELGDFVKQLEERGL